MAKVTVDGLMCEVEYTITVGGTLNGQLVGPRISLGNITPVSCLDTSPTASPTVSPTVSLSTSKSTTYVWN